MAESPQRRAILAVLADGDWHDREELIRAGAGAIAPGVAYRTAERARNQPSRRPGGPGARVRGTTDTSVRSGARRMARTALNQLNRNRLVVEVDGDRYRLANGARP